jgi:hypothetical protein
MRPGLRIRVAFQPTRLSQELLRNAYEWIVPIITRQVPQEEPARAAHDDPTEVPPASGTRDPR